jgi:hypothetical protein
MSTVVLVPTDFTLESRHKQQRPRRAYQLHVFQLTEGDEQRLQLDPSHVPTLRVHDGSAVQFTLPVESQILSVTIFFVRIVNCLKLIHL